MSSPNLVRRHSYGSVGVFIVPETTNNGDDPIRPQSPSLTSEGSQSIQDDLGVHRINRKVERETFYVNLLQIHF